MEPGHVLIIDDDPWASTVLAKSLRDRGHTVETCTEARSGFTRACELRPDCIVCNVILPDIDGFWVARRIRTEPSNVSSTPFLFLTSESTEDKDSRLQGLHVGADAYLLRPFTAEEVVAQVEALIEMARRLNVRRSDPFRGSEPPSIREAAFKGDLQQMSLATVLMVMGMERRSGRLRVQTDTRKAELVIVADSFVSGVLDGKEQAPLDVLREVLRWKKGTFYFGPQLEARPPDVRASVSALLLEAIRLDDEATGR